MRKSQLHEKGASASDVGDLTIDELARRADTAVSTVRLYQTKGLLPPPTRRGRIGYYGDGHLARLRLIAQLQADGFSLASIARLVSAWEAGRSLDEVLGLESQVAAAWEPPAPVVLSPDELARWFPDGSVTPEVIGRVLALGLVGLDGDRIVIYNPRFHEVGAELAQLGVPVDEVLNEYEVLREEMAATASRFVRLFEDWLWPAYIEQGLRAEDVRALTDVLRRLSESAETVVALTLREAFARAARTFVAQHAKHLETELLDAAFGPLPGPVERSGDG